MIESLNRNGILHAQVVEGQIVGLPSETLISIGQIQRVESSEESSVNLREEEEKKDNSTLTVRYMRQL